MPNKVAKHRRDEAIARIAARQHGVVTIAQLRAAGILPSGVADRVNAGRLYGVHRGVYAVGHPGLSENGWWMAAVLASGTRAVLSHLSAAALWRFSPRLRPAGRSGSAPAASPIDVTIPGSAGRAKRPGIRVHRSLSLRPGDCTRRLGIPVTKPSRTLEDLRRVLSQSELAAAVREAEFLRLPIGEHLAPDPIRTELEARLLALCRRHRLPKPEVNVPVAPYTVDFLWREQRLIVEVDGWRAHRSRSAFEEDRARDAHLKVLGYEVLRFTWRQLSSDRVGVASTIRYLLRR